jgi:biotin carboxyl carrier protein
MRLDVEIGGTKRAIELDEIGGRFRLEVDGRVVEGDVLRPEPGVYTFFVGARVVEARVASIVGSELTRVTIGGVTTDVLIADRKHRTLAGDATLEGRQALTAPMPGKVVAVLVAEGEGVERGQGLVVVEAMKMQNEVKAPKAGVVVEVRVTSGETVVAGQVLAVVE